MVLVFIVEKSVYLRRFKTNTYELNLIILYINLIQCVHKLCVGFVTSNLTAIFTQQINWTGFVKFPSIFQKFSSRPNEPIRLK